jgi:hypothetical protein
VTPADLRRKYVALLALRNALAAAPSDNERQALRALASEFPGALRELDSYPQAELERRLALVEHAALDPWVTWMCRYHALMRDELARRRAGDRQRAPDGRLQKRVLQMMAAEFNEPVDALWEALFPLGERARRRDYRG